MMMSEADSKEKVIIYCNKYHEENKKNELLWRKRGSKRITSIR